MTFLGNFSRRGEKYYFHMEGSTRDEFEPTPGEIERMNIPDGGYPHLRQMEGGKWGQGARLGEQGARLGAGS